MRESNRLRRPAVVDRLTVGSTLNIWQCCLFVSGMLQLATFPSTNRPTSREVGDRSIGSGITSLYEIVGWLVQAQSPSD